MNKSYRSRNLCSCELLIDYSFIIITIFVYTILLINCGELMIWYLTVKNVEEEKNNFFFIKTGSSLRTLEVFCSLKIQQRRIKWNIKLSFVTWYKLHNEKTIHKTRDIRVILRFVQKTWNKKIQRAVKIQKKNVKVTYMNTPKLAND